jgi:uncharacterized membrane protein HdeD (DUF308 family)
MQLDVGQMNPRAEGLLRVRDRWMWFFGLGAGLVLVGAFAVAAAFLTTLTTVLVFGILLLVGGAVELGSAAVGSGRKGVAVHVTLGLLHLVAGGLMVRHPDRAAEALTLLLAAAFLVGGLLRVGYALTQPVEGRVWMLITGVVAASFGLSIWQQWPESGLWAIGMFIGIDLLLIGWSWVMFGLVLRRLQSTWSATAERATAPPADAH